MWMISWSPTRKSTNTPREIERMVKMMERKGVEGARSDDRGGVEEGVCVLLTKAF